MTVALTLKVNDGAVLAADSASTLTSSVGNTTNVVNVYNNANKVFNLRKGLPIGLVTWGLGQISETSIETLAKDLRRRFSGDDQNHPDWHLDAQAYTISEVANRVKEFMYDEKYLPAQQLAAQAGGALPELGFFVVGYSANADHAEEYHLNLAPAAMTGPALLRQAHETGVTWAGQPAAISRILTGADGLLASVLENDVGMPATDVKTAMDAVQKQLGAPMVSPAMPLQDAIDLADYLVDLSIKYSRFMPGSPTVGGPVECAAISKHEGFRWIKRKHYYDQRLNP